MAEGWTLRTKRELGAKKEPQSEPLPVRSLPSAMSPDAGRCDRSVNAGLVVDVGGAVERGQDGGQVQVLRRAAAAADEP